MQTSNNWRLLLAASAVVSATATSGSGAPGLNPESDAKQVGQDPLGGYDTRTPAGLPLRVEYCIPEGANADTPILIVVPGARRNAGEYRDQWADLAIANGFIVLTLGASAEYFPTEYDYNAGGVVSVSGKVRPHRERLFAAIEPMFEDFCRRFPSDRETYSIYGHSAGGGFVHRYLLMEPEARVDAAICANPAFCSFPQREWPYPFGMGGVNVNDKALAAWFGKPLTVLLGDRDLNPRTKPLSNGPSARRQGPHVYGRGLNFFQTALAEASRLDTPLMWRLVVVNRVGHSNQHMASHAVKLLPHLGRDPFEAAGTSYSGPSDR